VVTIRAALQHASPGMVVVVVVGGAVVVVVVGGAVVVVVGGAVVVVGGAVVVVGGAVVVVGGAVVVVGGAVVVVVVGAGPVVVVGGTMVVVVVGGQGFGSHAPAPTLIPPWVAHAAAEVTMQVPKAPPTESWTQHWTVVGAVVVVTEGAVVVVVAGVVVVVAGGAVVVVVVAGGVVVVVVSGLTQVICPASHAAMMSFAHCARSFPPGGPHVVSMTSRQAGRLHGGGLSAAMPGQAPGPQASQQLELWVRHALPPCGARHAALLRLMLQRVFPLAVVRQQVPKSWRPQVDRAAQ